MVKKGQNLGSIVKECLLKYQDYKNRGRLQNQKNIIKYLISSLSNLAETLQSQISKEPKFEVSNSKNKKLGQQSRVQKDQNNKRSIQPSHFLAEKST